MKQLILLKLASLQSYSIHFVRIAIFIVMAWIGGLKFVPYEAESIVPFVANSPVMSFFYAHPAPEYKAYMNKEGAVIPQNVQWHESNRTYIFSDLLGTMIILIGVLMLLGIWSERIGLIGDVLALGMSITTLSFLITTPEAWVHGDLVVGVPYLSGAGRLVIKDLIMLSGILVSLSDHARKRVMEGVC